MNVILAATALVGCKRPPEAPTELNELAGFVFEHFMDEDTAELEAGVDNLDTWIHGNVDATQDGYTVDNLAPSVIDSVDPDREHDLENLGGASVAYISAFPVVPIARSLVLREQEEVFPKSYDLHDREFLTDTSCFMSHGCDLVDTDNVVESSYGGLLNIQVSTHSRAQFRWVEYGDPEQWALVHRTWLLDPAEVSMDGIDVKEQLYAGVTLKWEEGSAVRIGTTWISAEIFDGVVSEGTALNMMIDAMSGEGEDLDAFLAAE
jgi:hypothetical protein